jgi:GntR family transcriptional repressor for pyruvate dehydrogenase complex
VSASAVPIDNEGKSTRSRRSTLPHQVQRDLLEYLSQAGYKAGDQLPTEQALCEQFGASRTAIREAMKYMEILGVVSIEPGRGTFLKSFDVGNLLANLPMQLILQPHDILEVIRVRQVLEEYCLEQAIIHGDQRELHLLGTWVDAMRERADHGEAMALEDTSFHRQLALMSHSRLLLVILELFWDLRKRLPYQNGHEAIVQRYQRHQRIYTAVQQRDLQLARCYLIEHFSGSYEELLPAIKGSIADA